MKNPIGFETNRVIHLLAGYYLRWNSD